MTQFKFPRWRTFDCCQGFLEHSGELFELGRFDQLLESQILDCLEQNESTTMDLGIEQLHADRLFTARLHDCRIGEVIGGTLERFDVMSSLPSMRIPGVNLIGDALVTLGVLWYGMKDKL